LEEFSIKGEIMSKMSNDEFEALDGLNDELLGYGEPTNLTKRLEKDGYIQRETVGDFWKAKLTVKGKKAISSNRY
jgi:hypothetical protein